MSIEQTITFLEEKLKEIPQLVHTANLLRKLKESGPGTRREALSALTEKYESYLRQNLELKGYAKETIVKRVELLNGYYNFYDFSDYDYNSLFTSQGKLRPTILEEFLFLLFNDLLSDLEKKGNIAVGKFGIGSAKAYTNLFFSPVSMIGFANDPSVKLNVKDQDFAIYRDVPFTFDEDCPRHLNAKVPVLAVEVKTYLDKTMLEGVIATADKLKMGSPYARFIVASESYQVDLGVDPSYSQIDQIYILRKCGAMRRLTERPDIDTAVVLRMFDEAKSHLERPWSDVRHGSFI